MVKVKIVKDGVKGADDGATVRHYPKDGGPEKDGVYDVSESLASVFIEAHEAEEVDEKKPTVTDKVKAKSAAAAAKAAEKAEAEKAAAEKAEAEKAAAEKAEAEKAEAEKAAAEKAAAEKAGKPAIGLPPIPGSK
ncbi:hypothetical protein [Rhizobium leguminosarum]|uniref:hypothetical protein n=1 Tax=Rhizobium leguminosarum TaxID=384 RepID=UPI00197EABC9|nr:hypothetical protein [Rhizobium leguminosarum]